MPADSIRHKYSGDVARGYERKRSQTEKWNSERSAVYELLSRFESGLRVLDIPVGTGRFAPIYQALGLKWVGIDVSQDMLAIARAATPESDLAIGDIFSLDVPDKSFDVSVCVRFLNWLTEAEMVTAIGTIVRVTKSALILGIRIGEPTPAKCSPHRKAAFDAALNGAGFYMQDAIIISSPARSIDDKPGELYSIVLARHS